MYIAIISLIVALNLYCWRHEGNMTAEQLRTDDNEINRDIITW